MKQLCIQGPPREETRFELSPRRTTCFGIFPGFQPAGRQFRFACSGSCCNNAAGLRNHDPDHADHVRNGQLRPGAGEVDIRASAQGSISGGIASNGFGRPLVQHYGWYPAGEWLQLALCRLLAKVSHRSTDTKPKNGKERQYANSTTHPGQTGRGALGIHPRGCSCCQSFHPRNGLECILVSRDRTNLAANRRLRKSASQISRDRTAARFYVEKRRSCTL